MNIVQTLIMVFLKFFSGNLFPAQIYFFVVRLFFFLKFLFIFFVTSNALSSSENLMVRKAKIN